MLDCVFLLNAIHFIAKCLFEILFAVGRTACLASFSSCLLSSSLLSKVILFSSRVVICYDLRLSQLLYFLRGRPSQRPVYKMLSCASLSIDTSYLIETCHRYCTESLIFTNLNELTQNY